MSEYEIDIAQVHPDWMALWAPELPAPTRDAILTSERFAHRAGARIAAALGAEPLANAVLPRETLRSYRVYMADPSRALRVIGLVLHARRLARIISGHELRELAEYFPAADLAVALGCRDLVPASSNNRPAKAEDAQMILDDAVGAVRLWLETLANPLADRVTLTLPKDVEPMDVTRFSAATQVALVGTALLALEEKTQWQMH